MSGSGQHAMSSKREGHEASVNRDCALDMHGALRDATELLVIPVISYLMPLAGVRNSEALSYCTFGAACTEVELDVLTGEQRVLRSDILFDCGRSINPALDMGQVRPANVSSWILSNETGPSCTEALICRRRSSPSFAQ